MQDGYITATELQSKTNDQLAELCTGLTNVFRKKNTVASNQGIVVGFLQLAREIDKRGLQISETKFGKIILEPKSTRCQKCGDEGWIYQRNSRVRKCNCKPVKQPA